MTDNEISSGFRLAHTMMRVQNLELSLKFYCDILGMKVLRKTDYPDGKFTNTFIGYGPETEYPTLELTYNWDQAEPYEKGNGWGHICVETPDVYKACESLSAAGIKSGWLQSRTKRKNTNIIKKGRSWVTNLNYTNFQI